MDLAKSNRVLGSLGRALEGKGFTFNPGIQENTDKEKRNRHKQRTGRKKIM